MRTLLIALLAVAPLACAGPLVLAGTSTAPTADVRHCAVTLLEERGYTIATDDADAERFRARRETFTDEPMFDVIEVRIRESPEGRLVEVEATEMQLRKVAAPSAETRRDAEDILARCAASSR